MLEVLAGMAGLTEGFASAAETGVGACLLFTVPCLKRNRERGCVMAFRIRRVPGGLGCFAQAVECSGLLSAVARRTEQRQRLPVIFSGLLRVALGGLGVA
jgi:hypothetical protein